MGVEYRIQNTEFRMAARRGVAARNFWDETRPQAARDTGPAYSEFCILNSVFPLFRMATCFAAG